MMIKTGGGGTGGGGGGMFAGGAWASGGHHAHDTCLYLRLRVGLRNMICLIFYN